MRHSRQLFAALMAIPILCITSGTPEFNRATLPAWGLPSDLVSQHIEELSLPRAVDRLHWLPPGLKVLDVNQCAVWELSRLPESLTEINARYTAVRELPPDLPPHLRTLDVTTTEIAKIRNLPDHLVRLKLGSTHVREISSLPSGLDELDVEGAVLTDFRSLPGHLKSLTLKGSGIEGLNGLPSSLRSLSLIATRVSSLQGLPDTLETLELTGNAQLKIDYLPRYLSHLIIDQPSMPDLRGLKFLTTVEAKLGAQVALASLPDSITSLSVIDLGAASPNQFPPHLTTLSLVGHRLRSLDASVLPASLESLVLEWALNERLDFRALDKLREITLRFAQVATLEHLPAGLLVLDVRRSPLGTLPKLPESLRVLRVRSSQVTAIARLPDSLVVLDLTSSHGVSALPERLPTRLRELYIRKTQIAHLPVLPASLRILDIAYTSIAALPGLPAGLEELRLSPRQIRTLGKLPASLRRLKFTDIED
jgi:E3 ubiquitin-protein ligase SspH2